LYYVLCQWCPASLGIQAYSEKCAPNAAPQMRISLAPLPILSLGAKRTTLAPIKRRHPCDKKPKRSTRTTSTLDRNGASLPVQWRDPRHSKPVVLRGGLRCGDGGAILMMATPRRPWSARARSPRAAAARRALPAPPLARTRPQLGPVVRQALLSR